MKVSQLKNDVVITLLYEDDTTRSYTFENVADSDLPNIKTRIKAINANANNEYANFYKTFVSNDGEKVVEIESCKIMRIDEEVIYVG